MKTTIRNLAPLALLLAASIGAAASPTDPDRNRTPRRSPGRLSAPRAASPVALKAINECAEFDSYLTDVVLETLIRHKYWWVIRPWFGPERDTGGGDSPTDYTTTNVQEEGVDELDIVKTDGNYLYIAENDLFAVVQSWPAADSRLTASLELSGAAYGLFLYRDLAVVISNFYNYHDGPVAPEMPWGGTRIELVDVTDRSAPTVVRTIDVEGYLAAARLIDGHIYAVISSYLEIPYAAWELIDRDDLGLPEVDWDASEEERAAAAAGARIILRPLVAGIIARTGLEELVPLVRDRTAANPDAGFEPLVGCGDLYRPTETSEYSMLSVLHLDLDVADPTISRIDATGLLADGWTVYASTTSLYVTQSSMWWWWGWGDLEMTTAIHKFALDPSSGDPVRYTASGEVEGWLHSQFSMGEHDGHLRVATTEFDWWWGNTDDEEDPGSRITVLADDGQGALTITGLLDGIAPGERIFACRFMADRGYLVTFEQIDPLFTLDLSDPTAPAIVGELEVTGFSSYLHPIGEDHLLAVGMEADPEGVILGLAVSVFDVSDFANPTLARRHLVEGEEGVWSWSEALHDHHAFTYHRDVLSIPAYVHGGESMFSGLIVLSVDPGSDIFELGRVDHSGLPAGPWGSWAWLRRSVYIEDALYSVSNLGVRVNELLAPEVVLAEVPFYEGGSRAPGDGGS
jgi:uncharacterized secreted protein with C-terminal beta-propeller domain